MTQVASFIALRECADGVCAEDACGSWLALVVASCRAVERVAERNCGGAGGREEGVRSRGSSSGLQGNEITKREPVLDGTDSRDPGWKEARLGTVSSSKVRMSRGLLQSSPESAVIFTMIMELVLRDLIKSWIAQKLARRLDDFVLAATCCADEVLVAASVAAAEVMVAEVIAKIERCRSECWCTETHWTSHPKIMNKSIMVDGLAVLWEEVLEFVGSKVCLEGNARHAIVHRTAQANKCLAKWRHVLNSSWLPRLMRQTTMWQGFSMECECLDDDQDTKRHQIELECENDGKRDWREEASMAGNGPVVETLAQDGSQMDRQMQH